MERPWYQRLFRQELRPPLPTLQARAESGDAEAQFGLAVILACAEGEARDYGQALHWYTKAADQDHALAQLNLGIMYARGQGVAHDEAMANVWLRRSAEQGDAGAQFNMGVRCQLSSLNGPQAGASESKIESYKWLHLAASQGYGEATASWEQVTLQMSHADVSRAKSLIAAFHSERPSAPSQ